MRQLRPTGLNGIFGDWTIPEREGVAARMLYDFGVLRTPVKYSSPTTFNQDETYAKRDVLLHAVTRQPLAVVSDRFNPILHGDLVRHVDAALIADRVPFTRRVATTRDGAQMLAEYKFPDVTVEIRPGDFVALTLTLRNALDLTSSIILQAGAFRMVCANGMYIGTIIAMIKARHSFQVNVPKIAVDLSKASAVFHDEGRTWRRYAAVPFGVHAAHALLMSYEDSLKPESSDDTFDRFPRIAPKYLKRIGNDFASSSDKSLWGWYNACTAVASHNARGINPATDLLKFANESAQHLLTQTVPASV